MFLIGIGFFWQEKKAHLVRLIGLCGFACFWVIWTIEYALYLHNFYNAIFTALAPIMLVFMGYHEYLDYRWNEETLALKWFSGVIFFAGFAYYLISYNPYVAAAVIYPVAWLTANLMNAVGLLPTGEKLELGEIVYDPEAVYVPIPEATVNIILACTAIQAIIIFAAVILFTSAPLRHRLKVFGVNFAIIYSLNIVRNMATIWLVGTGTMTFYMAHEVLGKTFSLIILMALAYWTFMQLPEILDNIYGLMDLRFRNKKGMVEDGFVVIPEKRISPSRTSGKNKQKKAHRITD